MKISLLPDSFKGSLSAVDYCKIGRTAIKNVFPQAEVMTIPLSDGGEGFIDSISYIIGGRIHRHQVVSLSQSKMPARIIFNKNQAFIESADTLGLTKEENFSQNINQRFSFSLGTQIKFALNRGAKYLYIGLGGTCTSDAGAGMLMALGAKFFDINKKEVFLNTQKDLLFIDFIDLTAVFNLLQNIKIIILSDVTNPLLGKKGAINIFAPQKGVQDLDFFNLTLQNFAKALNKSNKNKNFIACKGVGAAGGLGFAFLNLGAKINSGADFLFDTLNLEKKNNRFFVYYHRRRF